MTVAYVLVPSFAPWLLLDRSTAEHGDEVSALFYYNNTGSTAALRAWANWSLGGQYELFSLSPALPYSASADGFSIALTNVAPGFHSLTARFRVLSGLQDGLDMTIRVDWVAQDSKGSPLQDMTLPRGVDLQAPSVALALKSTSGRVEVGSVFTIELTLRNLGRAPAIGWLNLTLPSGVAYVGDNGTFAASATPDRVSWTFTSLAPGSFLVLGIQFSGRGELGVRAFRLDLNFTDGKGSPSQARFSNALSIQFVPVGSVNAAFPWWLLAILAAAIPGPVYLIMIRRRRGEASIHEVFVVDRGGGVLAHLSDTLIEDKDEDLVAAAFTAVQEFVKHHFSRSPEETIRTLEFGERKILLEHGGSHYIAVVFSGEETPDLRDDVRKLSEEINYTYGHVLSDWQGDTESIRGIARLLPDLWKR